MTASAPRQQSYLFQSGRGCCGRRICDVKPKAGGQSSLFCRDTGLDPEMALVCTPFAGGKDFGESNV